MGGDEVSGEQIDEKERLDRDDLRGGDLLAATHLHRYEVAAALIGSARVLDLCCGTGYGSRAMAAGGATVVGVDVAEEAVAAAREDAGDGGAVTFERADALEYLRGLASGSFEAVVCFEGIEHVPDPEAVAAELARLAEGGARVIFSLPNSKAYEERNRFHVTDFGWEEAQALISRFDAPLVLEQHLTEGSLIVPVGEPPQDAPARVLGDAGRDAPAWAAHWIVLVGFEGAAESVRDARLRLASSLPNNVYMRDLERANEELRRMNGRLGHAWLGVHDASSASLRRHVEEQTAEAKKWKSIADNNDYARQGLERRLQSPGHRTVDSIADLTRRVPGARLLRRLSRPR